MSTTSSTLAKSQTAELAERPPVPVAQMLQAVIERGMTAENVGVVEKLIELHERMEARDAEKQFAHAFNALQSELPAVRAMNEVKNNDGTTRYTYAAYESIMEQVRPFLLKHGFTVSFSSHVAEGRVIQECTIQHVGGHKRTNCFGARIGKGPPSSSEAQGDGAASTYAKRFALCDALNIVIESDSDARALGERISPEQANDLRERLRAVLGDEAAFLALAGVSTYEEIPEAKYDILDTMLRAKEAKRGAKG